MFNTYEKDLDLDSDRIAQKIKTVPQKLEKQQTPDRSKQKDYQQFQDSSSLINDLDVLGALQKMKTEEKELLEQKQHLLVKEQDLHIKLIKEMDKKKTTINNLNTEISAIVDRCNDLSQALGELASETNTV
jgi:hypothetical protein